MHSKPLTLSSSKNVFSCHCSHRLKLFILLHDVDEDTGRATQIISGSHNHLYYSNTVFTARFKSQHAAKQGRVAKLGGRRGDAYLFDTNALHRGSGGTQPHRDAVMYEFSSFSKYEAMKVASTLMGLLTMPYSHTFASLIMLA